METSEWQYYLDLAVKHGCSAFWANVDMGEVPNKYGHAEFLAGPKTVRENSFYINYATTTNTDPPKQKY
jgi:hypothetical protein